MPVFGDRSSGRDLGGEDFWQISPPASREYAPPRPRDTETAPVEAGSDAQEAGGFSLPPRPAVPETPSRREIPGGVVSRPSNFIRQSYARWGRPAAASSAPVQPDLLLEYEPADSWLRRVRVYRWPNTYHFYEKFIRNAHLSHEAVGHACPRVAYFSYIPQYSQLNRAQALFYFWFRDNARAGHYLPADLSYILLYVYEIINLPDKIPGEEGCRLLAALYLAYRGEHPELDRYLPEWICDYCLIHRLPPPAALRPILGTVIGHSTLKEFYFPAGREGGLTDFACGLIAAASDYDYTASRWYDTCREDFDRHIPGALCHALTAMRDGGSGLFSPEAMRTVTLSRDAFCGSLCEYNIKRRIDVELTSFTRSHELRGGVTAMVKYAENQIRARHHLKSRLAAKGLTPEMKQLLDGYFGTALPRPGKPAEPETPAYEALYDAPEIPFTADAARAIEAQSWEVTELLVETPPQASPAEWEPDDGGFAQEVPGAVSDWSEDVPEDVPEFPAPEAMAVTDDVKQALRALLGGGSLEAYCRERRLFPDELASRINEAAYDRLGDVALEKDGIWKLIPEYREDVEAWSNT